jgi:hypothetical protein
MSSVNYASNSVNSAEREVFIHALKTAAQKARLDVAVLENVAAAFRHRQIGLQDARDWLEKENLLSRINVRGGK